MTQVGESVAVTTIKDEEIEDNHFAGVRYCYPNGTPYNVPIMLTTTINNADTSGVFNFEGECIQTMLEPGSTVSYEIEEDVDDELKTTRKKIKASLDAIIKGEQQEQKYLDKQLEEESLGSKALIYTGAFMTGVGEGAVELVEFIGDGLVLGGKALWYDLQTEINKVETAWEKYVEGSEKDFFQSLNEKNIADFAEIFGISPAELKDKITQAYEMTAFIMEDNETKKMLMDFAVDYAKAQNSVELTNVGGSAVFDLILTAVLAVTTGGAGNAAQISAKVRHVSKFKALAKHLVKLVDLRKRKMLRKSVKGKLDEITEVKIKPPAKQKLKKNAPDDDTFKKKDGDKNDPKKEKNQPDSDSDASNDSSGKDKNGNNCPEGSKTCTGGEPISLISGEELLILTDFEMSGPLPLSWVRTYRSSNPDNKGLGHGWTHPFSETLQINDTNIELHDAEGRIIPFKIPAIGKNSLNKAEKLNIKRLSSKAYILTGTSPGPSLERYFETQHGSDTLQLTQIQDSHGNQHRLSYQQGKLQRITANFGDEWQLHYNDQNLIAGVQWHTPQGLQKTLVQYGYDENDDMLSATDAGGNTEHYAYQKHLIIKRTLKSGYSFYFQWDSDTPKARCIRNWGDKIDGKATYDYKFQWDPDNRRVAMTDTRGGVEISQFNDRGLPIYQKDPEGGETHYQYDALGNLTAQTDPLGHTERFTYDTNSEIAAYTDKQDKQQRLIRDHLGRVTQITDALGQNWTRTYNKHHQLLSQTNPLGETHQYQYNELGLISSITDPTGSDWHYIWDNQARLTAIRNPLGQHTRYSHNEEGLLTRITWPDKQQTEYRYDANGNCTAIKGPDGKVSQFAYNPLGLLTHHKDSSERITEYQYNGLSQVVRRIDPSKQILNYHYDGERNLIGLTNEKGEHYHLNYDLNERLIQETGFDGRIQRYQYNQAGQLVQSEDLSADGKQLLNQIGYQRDAQGRLLQQLNETNQQPINAFKYDALGRLTDARNSHRHLQWQYDAAGRIIEDRQGTDVLKHQYDTAGQRISSELPNGDQLKYSFDKAGIFTGLSHNGQQIASIRHDDMGREIKRSLSNQLVTDHSYDPQGRLQRQTTYRETTADVAAPSAHKALSDRQYHYNIQGQLSQIDDQIRGRTQYHYDALDRLTQVQGPNPESFVHDPAGNILSINSPEQSQQNAQVNGNRLAFQGDNHYQYDDKGNRIAQIRGKEQKLKTHYRYNALNQLEAVDNNGKIIHYAYDPLGRRMGKATEAETTHFLWMEDVLLSETTENDQKQHKQKTYLFEPGTFKPLAFVQDKQIYHYHLDHLGTPQEISDANGEIVWAVSFNAYGNLAVAYESQIENNLRFQGQYFDSETGLHYNRFRYYDPSCGRFINQDPIGLAGGNNNYLYVPNPTGWVDPFGLTAKDCPVVTEDGDDVVSVYHGSINDATLIKSQGLDASRGTAYVSRDIDASRNAIGFERYEVSQGLAKDPGIIESRIPLDDFNRVIQPFERPYGGFHGANLNSSEITLRSQESIDLFNKFIVK